MRISVLETDGRTDRRKVHVLSCASQLKILNFTSSSTLFSGSRTWVAHKRPPIDDRWMAFFVDVQYNTSDSGSDRGWPLGSQGTLEFTTTVSIVHKNGPDYFPYEECSGAECLGSIV